jgi:hypothetical protein
LATGAGQLAGQIPWSKVGAGLSGAGNYLSNLFSTPSAGVSTGDIGAGGFGMGAGGASGSDYLSGTGLGNWGIY